jgi:glycosyltransferase involved in cell wall biosynthesis
VVVSIDADLQQDPLALPKFVAAYIDGADIVFGVRNDRAADTWLKRSTARAFYSLLRLMGVDVLRNHADYRLLSGRALAVLAEHTEPNPFLRAICSQLGFTTAVVHFDVSERQAGVSKYSLLRMLKLAIEGITSFSVVPLRAVSVLGMLVFGVSAVMGCYVLARALIVGDTVPGWASTTLPIYFLGGVQILSIGIVGEYVAQITVAVKKRPRYVVETELF